MLRVDELIMLLRRFDPGAEVQIEGCDCLGEVAGVTTREDFYASGVYASHFAGDKNIIITREE